MWLEFKIQLTVFIISMCKPTLEERLVETSYLIKSLATTYCPYTNLCKANASQILTDKNITACCDDCSCASDCLEMGNCCPDKHNAPNVETTRAYTCTDTVVKRRRGDKKVYNGMTGIQRYMIVKNCPETEVNFTLVNKCKGKVQDSYEDFVWVSDPVTKAIYQNKFCAYCNGVSEYEEWRLATDCSKILEGHYSFKKSQIIPRNCQAVAVPPTGVDVSTHLCILPHVSKCNESGLWQAYNKSLEEACLSFELYFYAKDFFGYAVYRNVFCYLCNVPPGNGITHVCPTSEKNIIRGSDDTVFTGILDLLYYKKAEEVIYACAINEVYDEFMAKCRQLTCPILTAPFFGTCVRLTKQISVIGMSVIYQLHPVWEKSTLNTERGIDFEHLGKLIYKQFQHEFGLLASDCTSCTTTVSVAKKTESDSSNLGLPQYFVISSEFFTGKSCQEEFLVSRLIQPQGKEIAVTIIKDVTVFFTTTLEKLTAELIAKSSTYIFSKRNPKCPLTAVIQISANNICPAITLTNGDYNQLMMNYTEPEMTSQRERINFLFELESDGSSISNDVRLRTLVCLDRYKSIFSKNDALNLRLSETIALTAIFIIIRLF